MTEGARQSFFRLDGRHLAAGPDFRHYPVERRNNSFTVGFCKAHGWLEFDDVFQRAVCAEQDASFTHLVDDCLCEWSSWLKSFVILDKLDSEKEPAASNVAVTRLRGLGRTFGLAQSEAAGIVAIGPDGAD